MIYSEWKFGTLDLKTSKIGENTSKVYAIGFYVKDKV